MIENKKIETLTDDELLQFSGGKGPGFWDGVKDGMSEGADFVISLLG